ncbi:MAG: response regulator [Chloroflexi bacterium]|nr:response regulator [Chloroflexota bacterium]
MRRVLVVDDDPDIREVIGVALADEGYEVLTAEHGAAALLRVASSQPDVILLDLRMPVMNGWEFARRYRQTPGPHAPIVVLTAWRDTEDDGNHVEADAFLAKPFRLGDLLSIVDRYTRQNA